MKYLFRNWISRTEQQFGVDLSHLREILDISLSAFLKLLLMFPIASHRKHAPLDAWHLARVAATNAEGCSACLQMAVYSARKAGVPANQIRATLSGEWAQLPACLRAVVEFAAEVPGATPAQSLQSHLVQLYGVPAVMELAVAIATSRFFPTYKRALGYTAACAPLHVGP